MRAVQEKNVQVHFTGVERLTENGIVGDDGVERKASMRDFRLKHGLYTDDS